MADDVAYVAKLLAAPIAQYTHQNPSRPAPTREHPRSNGRNTHRTETHIFRNDTSGRGKPRSPSTGKPPHSREQHPPHRSAGRTEVTTSQKRARSLGSSPGASSKGRAAAEQLLPRGCSNKKGHLQCDWCNCQVGHGDRAWLTHVAGIQHRRETLSVQLYGEPGHMVISQFEPLPGSSLSSPHTVYHGIRVPITLPIQGAELLHHLHSMGMISVSPDVRVLIN